MADGDHTDDLRRQLLAAAYPDPADIFRDKAIDTYAFSPGPGVPSGLPGAYFEGPKPTAAKDRPHDEFAEKVGETLPTNLSTGPALWDAGRKAVDLWQAGDLEGLKQHIAEVGGPLALAKILGIGRGVGKVPGQTVDALRPPVYPKIYENPKVLAAEAASRAVPESENLGKVFPGVSRETLAEINKEGAREGNLLPSEYLNMAPNPRGSEIAQRVMNPRNAQRIIDLNEEAGKYPLLRDMDNWYVTDPLYKRMVEMFGPEEGGKRFKFLHGIVSMASPGAPVPNEIARGLAAHFLAHQGRFEDFVKHGGASEFNPKKPNAPYMAQIGMGDVPGHIYHTSSHAGTFEKPGPMMRYVSTGDILGSMDSPKVPAYINAKGVPEVGLQTAWPVGDAHWGRFAGLADVRPGESPAGWGASPKMPIMQDLAPWWDKSVAAPLGKQSVPIQARTWGAGSGATGVDSPIGPSWLEMFSDHVAKTAHRLGVSPETARDMILNGTAYAEGGEVKDD